MIGRITFFCAMLCADVIVCCVLPIVFPQWWQFPNVLFIELVTSWKPATQSLMYTRHTYKKVHYNQTDINNSLAVIMEIEFIL